MRSWVSLGVALVVLLAMPGCFRSPSTGAGRLLQAMENDDHGALTRALDAGADPNGKDWDGDPLLVYALYHGDEFVVQKLLEYGADPHIQYNEDSALNIAVGVGDAMGIVLIEHGATLLPGEDAAVLADAASKGSLESLRRLLEMGANPNPPNADDWHPLLSACEAGDAEAYALLLAAGASAPADAILEVSFESRNPEFIDAMLVAHPEASLPVGWLTNAVLTQPDSTTQWIYALIAARGRPSAAELADAFRAAAYENHAERLTYLIGLGADVAQGAPLAEVIIGAADRGDDEGGAAVVASLERLIEAGADLDAVTGDAKRSALLLVVESNAIGHEPFDFVAFLLGAGASVDLQDGAGQSALHLAAARGDPALTRQLLEAGANRALRDLEGRSAADLARARRPTGPGEVDTAARLFLKATGMGKMFELLRARYDEVLVLLGEDPATETVALAG